MQLLSVPTWRRDLIHTLTCSSMMLVFAVFDAQHWRMDVTTFISAFAPDKA